VEEAGSKESGEAARRRAGERPHAPRRSWVARLLGPLYFSGAFWYRVPLWIARGVPEPVMRPCVATLATLATLVLVGARRAVRSNLALALGPCGAIEGLLRVRRTFRSFAWCIVERSEQFVAGRDFEFSFEGLDAWNEVTADGSGFVLVTAHVGGWELGSTLPPGAHAATIHVVREQEAGPEAQAYTERLLEGLGGSRYRTHFAADDMSLGVTLLGALREGDVVALQADRPRSGGQSSVVELFGAPFDVPTGPAALARLAGVPIVPVFTVREGRRRYRVLVESPIRVATGPDRAADQQEALERVGRALEAVIARVPEQWFCFREVARAPRGVSDGPTRASASARGLSAS